VDYGGNEKIHFTNVEKISRRKKCEENYYCMYVLKVLRGTLREKSTVRARAISL
jgi:hypothetical protein